MTEIDLKRKENRKRENREQGEICAWAQIINGQSSSSI